MSYTVDPNNPASPADTDDASFAAAELRAIKTKMLTLYPGTVFTDTGTQNAIVDANLTGTPTNGAQYTTTPLFPNTITNPTFNGYVIFKYNQAGAVVALAAGDYSPLYPYTFTFLSTLNAGAGGWILQPPPAAQNSVVGGVRQTVQFGQTDLTTGMANFLTAGTGLSINLAASTIPLRMAFANGRYDYFADLNADVAGVVSNLAVNTRNYIYADYVGVTSVNWSASIKPITYSHRYMSEYNALLEFEGTVGSNQIVDQFGNAWTVSGGTKLQNTQIKYGSTALGGSGTNNSFNGLVDVLYLPSPKLGNRPFTINFDFYTGRLPTSSFVPVLAGRTNAAEFGAFQLQLGTSGKLGLSLSSNGSSWDIASLTVGITTFALNTWYNIELTHDTVNNKYIVYVNGTQDISVTSTAGLGWTASDAIALQHTGGETGQAYYDNISIVPWCKHPNGTAFTNPTVATQFADCASDWFSTSDYTMRTPTVASTVTGVLPTFSTSTRVYVGEAITGTAAVTTATTYALNGKWRQDKISSNGVVPILCAHNLGFEDIMPMGAVRPQGGTHTNNPLNYGRTFYDASGRGISFSSLSRTAGYLTVVSSTDNFITISFPNSTGSASTTLPGVSIAGLTVDLRRTW